MRMEKVLINKKLVLYGKGKQQQDFEFMFPELNIIDYIEEDDDEQQIRSYNEKFGHELLIIICHRQEEQIASRLTKYGMLNFIRNKEQCENGSWCFARDFFVWLEPVADKLYAEGKKLYIWGTGQYANDKMKQLEELDSIEWLISGFIDSKIKKGTVSKNAFHGYDVYHPSDILEQENAYILIGVRNGLEKITAILESKGQKRKKDFDLLDEFGDTYRMMEKVYYAYPDKNNQFLCYRGLEWIELCENGRLSFCCPGMQYEPYIGNLTEDSFEKIFRSAKAKIHKLSIKNGTYAFCNYYTCPWLKTYQQDKNEAGHRIDVLPDVWGTEKRLTLNLSYDRTCNLYCTSCRQELYAEGVNDTKRLIEKKIVNEIMPWLKGLNAAGSGEVFISKAFRQVLESVAEIDWIAILSNGNYIDFDLLNRLKKKCRELTVAISVDAATEETYHKIRRGGNFHKLLENLKEVSKLRKQGAVDHFSINFVAQKDNVNDMECFVQLGKELGVDAVCFTAIYNWGTYSAEEFKEVSLFTTNGCGKEEYRNQLESPSLDDDIVFAQWQKNNYEYHGHDIRII